MGWRVYPLDPRPDAVVLYSGCTPAATVSEPQPPIPKSNDALSTTNNIFIHTESSSSVISASSSNCSIQPPSASTTTQSSKKKARDRKRKKELFKTIIDIKMAQHRPRKSASVEYTTDEEDMIVYDVEDEL
ncbi:hypothetical protein TNCV_491011 [Trichonephila clavipes]|nr:hypothetical protein TNCV_491011 [Trichonephila clavipes]